MCPWARISNIHPETHLKAEDGKYQVEFQISSKELSISPPTLAPDLVAPPPTRIETILENMYGDTAHGDVSFIFDSDMEQLSTSQGSIKMDEETLVRQTPETVIHAHTLVLSQWPYFKAMLEGGFAESGPGEKQIHIRDIRSKVLEQLLRLMYTCKLRMP